MKELMYLLIGILLFNSCLAIVGNVTEFDDGSSSGNITANTTKYITLPLNVSIQQANLTLKGLFAFNNFYEQEYANVTSCDAEVVDCNNSFDANWTTYSSVSSGSHYAYETYYIPNNVSEGIIEAKFEINGLLFWGDLYYYDFSLASWISLGTIYDDGVYNFTIPSSLFPGYNNITLKFPVLHTGAGGTARNLYYYESKMWWENKSYPHDVLVKLNGTLVFNQTGNLTGTNDTDFRTALEACNEYQATCPLTITTENIVNFSIEYSNLFVEFNKTSLAILGILSPAQITASVISGNNYTASVNITNTGNYNATNITWETVSVGGTPNYNISLSSDCNNLTLVNQTSIICNVTFSTLIQNPEPDERLKFRAMGTDTGEWLYSPSIDVDITVTTPTPPSGGGGGSSTYARCNWKIYRPANKVWTDWGWYGFQTAPLNIIINNNESQAVSYAFSSEGLSNCRFFSVNMMVEGNSMGYNKVICDSPPEFDTGKIVVSGGGCDSSINVGLLSNWEGFIILFATGRMGMEKALLFWFMVFIVIALAIMLLGRRK